MPRIPTLEGFKFQSENGKFYIGVNTSVYTIHISIGRFSFAIDRSAEYRANRTARIIAKQANRAN